MTPHAIGRSTPISVGGGPWTVAEWRHRPADCLAVVLRVYGAHGPVEWRMARALLEEALLSGGPTGLGDVLVAVCTQHLHLRLVSPHGQADVALPVSEVEEFLGEVDDVSPAAGESERVRAGLDGWLIRVVGHAQETQQPLRGRDG
jgi:hypothetical protein